VACPKPAECRRSQRTELPARRHPNYQDRQFACSVQAKGLAMKWISNFRQSVPGAAPHL